jgi:hypothetical protein
MGAFARAAGALLICAAAAAAAAPREPTVAFTVSGPGSSLELVGTFLDEQACDGTRATARGIGVISGVVSGAFELVNASVAIVMHCGTRGVGQPSFDVTVEEGLLMRNETATLANFTIRAAIFDDVETGAHSLAGTLQSRGGHRGDSWWFDTCVGSFEVRSAPTTFQHLWCLSDTPHTRDSWCSHGVPCFL